MFNAEKLLKSTDKFKINLGLDRVKFTLSLFNNPQDSIKFFHIAGTNGKGSTAAILEQILIKQGLKVGKYTSPHLFSYTERFSINGSNIDEEKFNELVNLVNKKDIENNIGLSEFEILTVVCFLYFKKNNIDIGILETGLGGRLDATNIIKKPICSIITSISYDHKERLGNTIEKIAYEKAGILKENCPCVFLKNNKGYNALFKISKEKGAKIIEDDIEIERINNRVKINGKTAYFNLKGDFQIENLKLALLALKALPCNISFDTIKEAIKVVKWRFRLDEINYNGHKLLIDGCHNPDGARVLTEYINKYYKDKKIKFVFGCLKNKDFRGILKNIYNPKYSYYFYKFNYPNSIKYDELEEYKEKFTEIKDPFVEFDKDDYEICVVFGSLYMLGEIFKEFNFKYV